VGVSLRARILESQMLSLVSRSEALPKYIVLQTLDGSLDFSDDAIMYLKQKQFISSSSPFKGAGLLL